MKTIFKSIWIPVLAIILLVLIGVFAVIRSTKQELPPITDYAHLMFTEPEVEEVKEEETVARITKYAWTRNKMANGEWPHIGAIATSDRSIPFGTQVVINGKTYEVKDRTALWVHTKHGLTFDIYSEDSINEMLKFGDPEIAVIILTEDQQVGMMCPYEIHIQDKQKRSEAIPTQIRDGRIPR